MLKTYNRLLDDYGIVKSDHAHITEVGGRSPWSLPFIDLK